MWQTAYMIVNPIIIDKFASLLICTDLRLKWLLSSFLLLWFQIFIEPLQLCDYEFVLKWWGKGPWSDQIRFKGKVSLE